MRIVGIIAEYNPFHNGHIYQLNEAKARANADYLVVCMSGNLMQRGDFAILDKWTRAGLAIGGNESEYSGADLVIELPTVFACNRAEIFAREAVNTLIALGVTHISFGCETDDFDLIGCIANCFVNHKEEISNEIKSLMKTGISYAKAQELAITNIIDIDTSGTKKITKILSGANNILAIEYMKAIISANNSGKNVVPVPIKRKGATIDEADSATGIAGATKLREYYTSDKFESIKRFVPDGVYNTMIEAAPVSYIEAKSKAFDIIRFEVIKKSPEELREIYGVAEGLEHKLKKEIPGVSSFDELVSSLTSKRYTSSTIRRMLIYLLIGLKWADVEAMLSEKKYARVLAANDKGRELLREIKKKEIATIPIITNVNAEMIDSKKLSMDLMVADLYNVLFERDVYECADRVIRPTMIFKSKHGRVE